MIEPEALETFAQDAALNLRPPTEANRDFNARLLAAFARRYHEQMGPPPADPDEVNPVVVIDPDATPDDGTDCMLVADQSVWLRIDAIVLYIRRARGRDGKYDGGVLVEAFRQGDNDAIAGGAPLTTMEVTA